MHRIGFVVFAIAALAGAPAFAQHTVAIGKKGEVELRADSRVGSTTLKPGHYVFQQQSANDQHYLVVRAQATSQLRGGQHYAGATKEEVARVPCRMVDTPTGKKTQATALYLTKEADGVQRVTRIDIRGEKEGHVVTLEPQS